MRLARTLLGTVVLAAAAAPAGAADEKVRFDPTRDLPGFEETRSSELKDLFPVDTYADMLGREMDAKELADVQAKWRADSAAIQVHLDEVRTNPAVGVRWVLEKRMAQHKFFSKVMLTADASVPPFLIFVQKPSFDDPNYATSVVQLLAPYLTKTAAVFEERVAKPSGTTRRANRPLTPIVILSSPGDFDNYYRLGGPRDSLTSGADYEPKLDLVVFAVDSFAKPKATPAFVHPLMREAFLSMMTAYASPQLKKVPSLWLREGMAGAFTWPRGGKVEALDTPEPRVEDVKLLVELCHAGNGRVTYLHPVSVLSSISTWDGLTTRAFGQGSGQRASYTKLWSALLAQSSLWMHFLAYGAEGKYRAQFDAYLKMALTGQSGADALSFAFAGTKLADLDKKFWSWVYDQHQRLLPNDAIDREDLNDLFAPLPQPGANDEIVARAKQSLTPEKPEPPFDPATLAIADGDVESRHGLALVCARSGDFATARTLLTQLATTNPVAPEDGRIARDIQRLDAAIALRDGWLAALIAKSARLAIEVNGKKVNAPVAKVENGQIVFGDNAAGVKSIPLTALDPLEIAKQADKKELQGNAPAWARPWLYLLCGDARWEKLLKTDSAEAKDVKDDGTVWYRDRLQAGVAAQIVETLALKPLPKTRAEAEPILKTIRDLIAAHAKTPSVLLKKDALTACARAALLVIAAESSGADFVTGKLTTAADGQATLVYDFDNRAEANDFKLNKGHLADWRKDFASGAIPEDSSKLDWKEGAIILTGNAMWRLPIGFIAPLTMKVEYDRKIVEGKLQRMASLSFHVCDDGKDSYVHVTAYGQIFISDDASGASSQAGPPSASYTPGQTYTIEIVHDGRQVTSKVDGVEVAKAEAGTVVGGGVELMAVCDGPACLHKIEITGKVDPASLVAARGAWVTRMLREMGL